MDRKHYARDSLDDSSVLYAAAQVLTCWALDDEDDPRRWLMIRTDPAGLTLLGPLVAPRWGQL
ncbi:hypothetical protein [Acidipropionibacterium jensenii]|uniref:hypothetical protein n=1 Tax=Acidipropionibacterium jensenii TaxID=1749 RepID=UPI0004196C04|nr:hypothetical protein [Acidipropionibacterium jensenii]